MIDKNETALRKYCKRKFQRYDQSITKISEIEANLRTQVSFDLENEIQKFEDASEAFQSIAFHTKISQKTLIRYFRKDTTPQKKSLLKLYKLLTKSKSDYELKKNIPAIIEERIFSKKDISTTAKASGTFSFDFDYEMLHNVIFRKIYIRSCSTPFYKEEIAYRFGKEGEGNIANMISRGILEIKPDGKIVPGNNRIQFTGEIFKVVANDLIKDFFYPEKLQHKGENIFTYITEGLNQNGLNEILKIDYESLRKKIKVINNKKYQGEIPVWSITTTDTLNGQMVYES